MLSAPDNYGMNVEQTRAFQWDAPPPEGFDGFWAAVADEASQLPCSFVVRPSSESGDVVVMSARRVRIAGHFLFKQSDPTGVVIRMHGATTSDVFESDALDDQLLDLGLAVMHMRVRGYPPSVQDCEDRRASWILNGIDDRRDWILRDAAIDVAQMARVVDAWFNNGIPISFYGESFGGGMGILAATVLRHMSLAFDRLIVGLPTFGCWTWRLQHNCLGWGAMIRECIAQRRGLDREHLMNQLPFFDTVFHARSIAQPVLFKLADRDDTVPAPTASAIANAVPTDHAHFFHTPFGHYDGGLANARQHALFSRVAARFLDPAIDPDSFHVGESGKYR